MAVSISFCGFPVRSRQSIGIGIASSAKSVTVLMAPATRKYNSILMQWPPNSLESVPPSVSQKSWIGTHWNIETSMHATVRAMTKVSAAMRMRLNCWIGKMRY